MLSCLLSCSLLTSVTIFLSLFVIVDVVLVDFGISIVKFWQFFKKHSDSIIFFNSFVLNLILKILDILILKLLPIFKKRFKVINLNKIRTSAKYKIGNWYKNKKQAVRNLSTASIVNTKKVRFCSNVAILTNFITYIIFLI